MTIQLDNVQTRQRAVDEQRLNAFLGKAVADLGAAVSAVLVSIGDELGFYKALAAEAFTAGELAARTGTNARYVHEWLANQAAGGYVEYDSTTQQFSLSPEQAQCLADPNGPADLPGAYLVVRDMFHVRERALENFEPARAWNGVSIIRVCFMGPNASFGPATTRIS